MRGRCDCSTLSTPSLRLFPEVLLGSPSVCLSELSFLGSQDILWFSPKCYLSKFLQFHLGNRGSFGYQVHCSPCMSCPLSACPSLRQYSKEHKGIGIFNINLFHFQRLDRIHCNQHQCTCGS